MALRLMYITNSPEVSLIAEKAGVDRIYVDLEHIGKADRQGGMNTVQSKHTIEDIKSVRSVITKSDLLVRCNSIANLERYGYDFEKEIEDIISCHPEYVMLPYFYSAGEVERFVKAVDGRAKTIALVETPQAVEHVDDIIGVGGIDEYYIGLNDLSIGYGKKFMFEPLAEGIMDMLAEKFNAVGVPFGFGGIASIGKGLLRSEHIIMEHYRLGSASVILSRSFCNVSETNHISDVENVFDKGIDEIREYEKYCENHPEQWEENKTETAKLIRRIVDEA